MFLSNSNHPLTGFYYLLFCFLLITSCIDKEEILKGDLTKEVVPRSQNQSIPNSFFQLHNDYIIWVLAEYKDSAEVYITDPLEFVKFHQRKWFQYTNESINIIDVVLEDEEPILSEPHYTYNQGYTNEDLFDNHFSSTELGYIYTVIDSIYDAILNEEPQDAIQQIITNGKTRINSLNPVNEVGLINSLTQVSYSMALAFELEDLYGEEPEAYVWCFYAAADADNEAFLLLEAIDTVDGASGNLGVIVYASLWTFAKCILG